MARFAPKERIALAGTLFDLYYEDLFGYLYRLVDDRVRAADLAHETLLAAARDRRFFRSGKHERAWLFRIATNLGLGRPARRTWAPWREGSGNQQAVDGEPALAGAPVYGRPAPLEQAMVALPIAVRVPLLLAVRYGFTPAEMAVVLGTSEAAARSRLIEAHAAFEQLYTQANNQ